MASQSLNYPLDINDVDIMDKELLKPVTYHTTDPANSVKRNLLKLLGTWLKVPGDKLAKVDELVHVVYNCTLLLDDIQDNSALRRGRPTAHRIFGLVRTFTAFTYSHAKVLDLLEGLDNKEVTRIYMKAIPKLLAGQGIELYWRDNNICPTEEEYLHMAYLKVSEAFLLVGNVMTALSTGKRLDVTKLLKAFGIYFQVFDDHRNLCDAIYCEGKGFAEDLTEGKFSFPVVHAVHNFPEKGKVIMEILEKRTYDLDEKQRCIAILEECGSIEYTEKKIKELKDVIFSEIGKIDENPLLKQFLENAVLAYM